MLQIPMLLASTVLAFWISAICGGGASLILIPVLNVLLSSIEVPFALTLGSFVSSASRVSIFRKFIYWKIVLVFVPFSIPAVLAGAWLIKYLNPTYLQLLVALFLLLNTPELFRNPQKAEVAPKTISQFWLAVIGFVAGLVSGITGAVGLLFNRFYLRYGLIKEEIVATRAANEIILHAIKLIIYIVLGLYSANALSLGLTIAVGAVISSYSVRYILPFISETLFKKIGYGAMVVSGLVLFVGTASQIIVQDRIAFQRNSSDELAMKWRDSSFVLEFKWEDGLEVEIPISANEVPDQLQNNLIGLLKMYDRIAIEKVFRFGKSPEYEFYCYKGIKITKYTFQTVNI
jgi:uncharacterized membrane protein YfcA